MSNDIAYTGFLQALGRKEIDLNGVDDIRALLVDASVYTVSAAHDFLDDVAAGARIGSAVALANETFVAGVFDADDITFIAAPASRQADAILLYKHTGTESTSLLIAYIVEGYNLPLQTNGNDVNITWDNGVKKIFRLRVA